MLSCFSSVIVTMPSLLASTKSNCGRITSASVDSWAAFAGAPASQVFELQEDGSSACAGSNTYLTCGLPCIKAKVSADPAVHACSHPAMQSVAKGGA